MPPRNVPESASIALPGEGGRLHAPSAERNAPVICELLQAVGPTSGTALELASGTGQHVAIFAAGLPGLHWQPSDIDPTRRASIDAHAAASGLGNIAPALDLDAGQPGWASRHGGQALIVVVNLLHLISTPEAQTLIREAASALAAGGKLVIYGPFMRAGQLTSKGDIVFHTSLIEQDREIGYKDEFDLIDMAEEAGLVALHVIDMPANNLAFVLEKPAN